MNTGGRRRERSTADAWGKRAGVQTEGVWKDKAREETVAGFKGCRLAWPWRSHKVYGCVVCWVLWNRLAVTGHALCSWLIWSSHRLFFQECREKQARMRVAWPIFYSL